MDNPKDIKSIVLKALVLCFLTILRIKRKLKSHFYLSNKYSKLLKYKNLKMK